jgi:hypothetical protein
VAGAQQPPAAGWEGRQRRLARSSCPAGSALAAPWPPAPARHHASCSTRAAPGAAQMCGFTRENAAAQRQAFPPFPVIHGTVLAGGSGVEPPQQMANGSSAGVGAPAVAPRPLGGPQQLAGLASSVHQLRVPLLLLAQLGLAAAAGAVAARQWDKRSKALGPSLPGLGHRSPRAQR